MPATRDRSRVKRRPRQSRGTKAEVSKFAGDAYDLGRRAFMGVTYLKNLINIETKYFDYPVYLNTGSTPTVTYMSGIIQGAAQSQRLGNSLKLQSVEIHASVQLNPLATNSAYRMALVRDNKCLGAAPAATDVFASFTYGWLTPTAIPDAETSRFGILFDSAGVLSSAVQSDFQVRNLKHDGHIKYQGGSVNVSDALAGSLFLITYSAENTNKPTFAMYLRLAYTDD
jgi:hypothetical protein